MAVMGSKTSTAFKTKIHTRDSAMSLAFFYPAKT
jgi:hypothetical protein